MIDAPPGRNAASTLALWYFVTLGAFGAFHPYLAIVLRDLGASGATVAAIISVFPLGLLFSGPLWSWLADHHGSSRGVLRLATLGAALGSAAVAMSPTWGWMAAAVAVMAFARAPVFPLVDVLIQRTVRDGTRRYGSIRVWGSVGFVFAVSAVGWLMESLPRAPLYGGAVGMAGGAAIAFTLRGSAPAAREPLWTAYRKLATHRTLWPIWPMALLHATTISAYDFLFALHLDTIGLSSSISGFAIAVGVTAEVAVMAASRPLLRRWSPWHLVIIGVASGIPRWLITGASADPLVLVAAQSLHGLGYGAWWIGALALLADRAPDHLRNSAQSLFVASGYGLGSLLAMVLAAAPLQDGQTPALFTGLAALSALALVPTWRLRRDSE